jgi:rubrerythrin
MTEPKEDYQITYGEKGSAYIHSKDYEDHRVYEWCTDYDKCYGAYHTSDSLSEAIEASKKEIDENVEFFKSGVNELQPDESWNPIKEFDLNDF